MDREQIQSKVEQLLSAQYHCGTGELRGKGTFFSVCPDEGKPHLQILAYRNSVVVCASEGLYPGLRQLLQGKSRDEIFEVPFVYGQTIHFVPGQENPKERQTCYALECRFGQELQALAGLQGFENSLAYDDSGWTPTKAAVIARDRDRIIAVAGAAESGVDGLWEVGVDVAESYRNAGLATLLVTRLTKELLAGNIVPFYSASVTNLGSQMAASRCGYIPAWMDTFGTTLDGSSVYAEIVRNMSLDSIK
ncbi:MAG: GNAT family N-acetyltransferase [Faecousia sp.]